MPIKSAAVAAETLIVVPSSWGVPLAMQPRRITTESVFSGGFVLVDGIGLMLVKLKATGLDLPARRAS